MFFKRDDQRVQTAFGSRAEQFLNEKMVTAVDTIEETDGGAEACRLVEGERREFMEG